MFPLFISLLSLMFYVYLRNKRGSEWHFYTLNFYTIC
jgi:hypothetical protein